MLWRRRKSLASGRNETTIPQMFSLQPSCCTGYVNLTPPYLSIVAQLLRQFTTYCQQFSNYYYIQCLVHAGFLHLWWWYKQTYLLNYLLTPWIRVFLEKLTGFKLVKEFLAFYGTRRFITAFIRVCHMSLS